MISLRNVTKSYPSTKGQRVILNKVSYDFAPGVNVGILGRNGAGKSTMMRIISGAELPNSGTIERTSRVSWPLGFACGFSNKLTGRENLRFVCRLYGERFKRVSNYVEDFADIGEYMDMPISTYSSGMRAKLTFGISMAFQFDYYLIDELTAVGDAVFRVKSEAVFQERSKTATLLVVSHSMPTIKRLCSKMLVLHQGKLLDFASNEEAEKFYLEVCCGQKQ